MKYQMNKEEFDQLPEAFQTEYVEKDGEYVLNIEGGEDTGALKRAKDHEKGRRQKAETKATELESKLADLQEQLEGLDDPGRNKGDDKLRIKLEQKVKELETSLTTREAELFGEIKRLTSEAQADMLAMELSDSPSLLRPHIKSRLITEFVDGKSVVRVKDPDGDVGVMTLDDLRKEIMSNKEYSPILKGSGGSGSGAPSGNNGGGNRKPLDYSKATPKEIAADIKAKKESH